MHTTGRETERALISIFFTVVYSQSNQIGPFILRKGENIWVMLVWSLLRMKSNGIISPSAHWHQGLFGYVDGFGLVLHVEMTFRNVFGSSCRIMYPLARVSIGNWVITRCFECKFSDVHLNNWGTVGWKRFSYIDAQLFLCRDGYSKM